MERSEFSFLRCVYTLLAGVVCVLLCASCAGTQNGGRREAAGESMEEETRAVLAEWKDAVYSQDIDWYMGLHWEDAVKINGEPTGVLHFLEGAGEIREEMERVFSEHADFLSEHEYPPAEYSFDEETGSSQIVFGLENPHFYEVVRFEEREGELRVSEHWVLQRFFGDLEAGEFTQWADEAGNGNGVLEPEEQERLFIESYRVTHEPGEVNARLYEFFDWNNDGHVDDYESELAAEVLFRNRLRGIERYFEEFARHRVPPADEPRVNIHDANFLYATVISEDMLPSGPTEHPDHNLADFNEDGVLSPIEPEVYRDFVMRIGAINPAPVRYNKEMPAFSWELREWIDVDLNGELGIEEIANAGFELFEATTVRGGDVDPAKSPIFRFFDRNRDGVIMEPESQWCIDFLVTYLLPTALNAGVMVEDYDRGEMVPFEFDVDDDPASLSDEEMREIRSFIEDFAATFWRGEEPVDTGQQWLDRDENGAVEVWEGDLFRDMLFQALVAAWMRLPEEEANTIAVRSALDKVADRDGDGMLSVEEREVLIRGLSHPHKVESDFEREIDFDGNGELVLDELFRAKDTGYIPSEASSAERRIVSLGSGSSGSGGGEGSRGTSRGDAGAGSGDRSVDAGGRGSTEGGSSGGAGGSGAAGSGSAGSGAQAKVKAVSTWGSSLAVLGVRDMTEKMAQAQTDLLVSFLENAFVNYGNVTVVDRQNLEKIMEEYKYQTSALVDEETAVEIGKLSGADAIAIGNLSVLADTFYLHLKVINVQSGAIIGSSISEGASEKDFLGMCNGAVGPLF